ncbi:MULTISPECIES: DNA-processing protein DprA [Rodentibacter]|uniref:DNA-processing protein DprA n=1 Tax=Rodentibacter TaxID=1960084 RepID=UPI001CFD916B|nr:DNA-processing protein DprA [Rodentibacter sp. JRC1]GJI55571.1 hypothetical protein HEMROJRC1_06830 [Rodentibacter sp. JRC1]
MKYTNNALNILTAKTFKGIGDAWVYNHLEQVQPYEVIVELLQKTADEKVTEEIFLNIRENIEQKILKLGENCDGVVALGDDNFPAYRGNVKASDRPTVLFYKGNLELLSLENYNIAVIGVLSPTPEIEQDERKMVTTLVEKNAVIVSGLALGCDRIAHHQSLKAGGSTIGILPSPLNDIIPKECIPLANYMAENGSLLITEYYDQPKSKLEANGRFIKRDRLQALFSNAVILTASYKPDSIDPKEMKIDSGSRHAMEKAKEYGLLRGVMYHNKNKNNPKFDLNRQIIKEDNNVIVIDPQNASQTTQHLFISQEQQSSLF